MKLSIVTTLYKSAHYVEEFYKRITKVATKITDDFEIIFVNDGSPDNSLEIAYNIYLQDAKVKIIELSRNFGHHKAMVTGLKYAEGDYIFLIDSDLEENPELLEQFWDELREDNNIDVIFGVQKKRKGNWFERWSGHIYFKVLNKIADEVKIPENISTIRLMKKNYVKELITYQEQKFNFVSICRLVGFNQKGYFFQKNNKKISSYGFLKKYHLFLDAIISFSSKPLYFIFYFGICLTMLSFLYMLYLLVRKMIWGIAIKGWTSLVVLISFFGGINMFFLGIISIYMLHIFQETKARPFSIVRRFYNREFESKSRITSEDNSLVVFKEHKNHKMIL